MSKPRKLGSRIVSFFRLLLQTAGLLSAILTILTFLGLGSALYGYFYNTRPLVIIGGAVFFLTILFFIFFYTFLEDRINVHLSTNVNTQVSPTEDRTNVQPIPTDTIVYPTPVIEDDFEIILKEIAYTYTEDGQTMWQRKRLHLRALKNGTDHFTDRYRWTGNGTCIIRSLTQGFKITNERLEEFMAMWNYFDVTFPRFLHKGEEVDFTIEWELFDQDKVAIPFLATLIDRETSFLSLQVLLPPKMAPTRAYCHEFANNVDTLPIETRAIKWSPASRRISYEVSQPKKHHKYLIRWYYD